MSELDSASPSYIESNLELTPPQALALAALLEGQSVAQAGEQAGVSRYSVYRWLKSDPQFRAAHNRWMEEMHQSCKSRLVNLAGQAQDVLRQALTKGDPWVAMHLLRALGMLRPNVIGETDPQTLARIDSVIARKREQKLFHLEDKYGTPKGDIWPPVFELAKE